MAMSKALEQLRQIIPPRGGQVQEQQVMPDLQAREQLRQIIPPRADQRLPQEQPEPVQPGVVEAKKSQTLGEKLEEEIGDDITPLNLGQRGVEQAARSEGEMIAAGSMAGGRMGAGAGPVGVAVGGAVGAIVGELQFQGMEDIARERGVEGLGESPKFSERITRAGKEGVIDLGFTVGTKAVMDLGIAGYKRLIPKETRELIEEADKLGIEPNKIVTTNGKLKDFYRSVVARFPFSSGAYRGRAKRSILQIERAKKNMFMRMGPSWDMAKLGIELDDAFKKEFSVFRKEMNKQYTAVLDEANKVGAFIDTKAIKAVATKEMAGLRLALQAQGMNEDEVLKALQTDESFKRLRQYTRMKDVLTVEEFRAMDDILDKDLSHAGRQGGELIANFGRVKDSFQTAKDTVRQLQPPAEGGKTVKDMWRDTDQTFTNTMTEMFETPVAKKLERSVNKKMFKVGAFTKAGTKNPDESFKLLWNNKSPQAMEQLHKVVGTNKFGAAMRTHLDTIWDRSVQKGFDDYIKGDNKLAFDLTGLQRQLGIGNPKSAEYLTTKRALELAGSGVTMKDLTKFTSLLENALRNSPENVNSFIARRAMMGGRQGVFKSFGMGAVGLTQSALTLLVSTSVGTIISGKPLLQRAALMLDPNISLVHRKAIATSLDKMLEEN